MMYYVDDFGNYLGGSDNKPLSENEVPDAPNDARQKWNGTSYNAIAQDDTNADKDAQVENELGGDNIRILVDIFKQVVNDGTIATKTPDEIIIQAKAKRRSEL